MKLDRPLLTVTPIQALAAFTNQQVFAVGCNGDSVRTVQLVQQRQRFGVSPEFVHAVMWLFMCRVGVQVRAVIEFRLNITNN